MLDRVAQLSRELATEGAAAIALMGTSLSFYRGTDWNEQITRTMREAGGLPATTMSAAIVAALHAVHGRRLAVATAYTDEMNRRLRAFLEARGFEVASLVALELSTVEQVHAVRRHELEALGERAVREATNADAVLISCGGLRTAEVTAPLEARTGCRWSRAPWQAHGPACGCSATAATRRATGDCSRSRPKGNCCKAGSLPESNRAGSIRLRQTPDQSRRPRDFTRRTIESPTPPSASSAAVPGTGTWPVSGPSGAETYADAGALIRTVPPALAAAVAGTANARVLATSAPIAMLPFILVLPCQCFGLYTQRPCQRGIFSIRFNDLAGARNAVRRIPAPTVKPGDVTFFRFGFLREPPGAGPAVSRTRIPTLRPPVDRAAVPGESFMVAASTGAASSAAPADRETEESDESAAV